MSVNTSRQDIVNSETIVEDTMKQINVKLRIAHQKPALSGIKRFANISQDTMSANLVKNVFTSTHLHRKKVIWLSFRIRLKILKTH